MNLRGKDCYVVAKQNGYSEKDTDRCENGSLNCQGCGFFKGYRKVLSKQNAIDEMIEFAKQHIAIYNKELPGCDAEKGYSHAMVDSHGHSRQIKPLNDIYFTGPIRELKRRRKSVTLTAQHVWDSNVFESD